MATTPKTPEESRETAQNGGDDNTPANPTDTPQTPPNIPPYDFGISTPACNASRWGAPDFCERYRKRYGCFVNESRRFIGEKMHPGDPVMGKMVDNLANVLRYAPCAMARHDLFKQFNALLDTIAERWPDTHAQVLTVRHWWHLIGARVDGVMDDFINVFEWGKYYEPEYKEHCKALRGALIELSAVLLAAPATPAPEAQSTEERLTRILEEITEPQRRARDKRKKQQDAYKRNNPDKPRYDADLKRAFKLFDEKKAEHKKAGKDGPDWPIFKEVCKKFKLVGFEYKDEKRVPKYEPLYGMAKHKEKAPEKPMAWQTLRHYYNNHKRGTAAKQ